MPSSTRQFINQDLRQRSFRRRNLRQAVFLGCDLRGCHFQGADLRGATFRDCRTGYAAVRLAIAILVLIGFAVLMFHAVSSMVFGAMGTLPGQPAWPYVLALYIVLAIAATSSGLQTFRTPFAMPIRLCTASANAALMGFFYGGSLMNNNPVSAVVGAVALGTLGLLVAGWGRTTLVSASLALLSAIATYGFTWVVWTAASDYLTTGHWNQGLILGMLAAFSVGIALRSLTSSGRLASNWAGTSFRGANLTGCGFISTRLRACDLAEVIGFNQNIESQLGS
ncbi:MAG: pentapeptide repeat-containing protein [Cyanobacteria bacterium J06559_3]